MRTSRSRVGHFAIVIGALALIGVACGGDPGGRDGQVATLTGATATTAVEDAEGDKKSFEDAMLEYAKCMRENGVDMPDPTFTDDGGPRRGAIASVRGPNGGGTKPDDATFQAAMEKCEPIMERAEQDMPRLSPEEEAQRRDQALKFAQCMRANGIDMPDPTVDDRGRMKIQVEGGGGDGGKAGGVKPATEVDGKFQAAMEKCEQDAPMKRRAAQS